MKNVTILEEMNEWNQLFFSTYCLNFTACSCLSFLTTHCRLWAMSVRSALLNHRRARDCCRVWCGVPQPLVHIRSAHVAESGTRSDKEQVWEAACYLPFSGAKIGAFFQERPLLRNPFLEDALLRGYLKRHLPQEVRRKPCPKWCSISSVLPEKGCRMSCFRAEGHAN